MPRYFLALVMMGFAGLLPAQEIREKPLLVLETGGHTSHVSRVFFTPSGQELISVSGDKTIRLWDVHTGDQLQVLRLPIGPDDFSGPGGGIQGAALSADGRWLAVGAQALAKDQHWIFLVDVRHNHIIRLFKGHSKPIWAVAFSRDRKWLASGGEDNTIRIWDAATGMEKQQIHGSRVTIRDLAFSPDGKKLASCGQEMRVRLWSTATGQSEGECEGAADYPLNLAWSPDGKILAACGHSPRIHLWNRNGSPRTTLEKKGRGIGLAFAPDNRHLLVGAYLFDLSTDKIVATFASHGGVARSVALSPDGRLAAWGGFRGEELFLWDATSRGEADPQVVHRLGGGGRPIRESTWSPDNKTIAWKWLSENNAEKQPAGRSFSWGDLKIGPNLTGTTNRGQHQLGNLSLEQTGKFSLAVKRGSETATVIKFPNNPPGIACFSFVGEQRVAVAEMGGLFLIDAQSGKRLLQFKGASGIRTIAPSSDNRYLLTGGMDQVLRIWSVKRELPVLSLFVAGEDWIAWTPEGYYAASPGGERLMGWQINKGPGQFAAFHSASRFRQSLYRPAVLRHLLDTNDLAKALDVANKEQGKTATLTEVEQVLPPTVAITAPESGTKITDAKLLIKATAESVGNHPLVSMQLLLDGRPYEGHRGLRGMASAGAGPVDKEWAITVPPGTHHLAVLARSAVSTATSSPIEVTFAPETPMDPQDLRPSLYVLAIGINAYPGDLKLDWAVNDAQELAQCFEAKSKPLFRQVHSRVIRDKDATRDGILQGMTWLKEQMKPHDVATIFYAGHGHKDQEGRFYLLSMDMNPDQLEKTTVTGEDMKKRLAELPGRVILLLDACHSGAIGGSKKGSLSITDDLARELADDDCGVIVMCAAMGKEESGESRDAQHGFFTLALIEGLGGKADYNKDGLIQLTELDLFVDNRVTQLSKDEQHPVTAKPTTVRSFALTKP